MSVWGFCHITRTLEVSLWLCWWRKPQCHGTKDIPRCVLPIANTWSLIRLSVSVSESPPPHSPVQFHQPQLGTPPSSLSLSLCLLTPLPSFLSRLQLRKDVSSSSSSPAASNPADTPHQPERAKEEGGGPGGKVSGEAAEEAAPKGAALAQEKTAKQDQVCGWVILVWWANKQRRPGGSWAVITKTEMTSLLQEKRNKFNLKQFP